MAETCNSTITAACCQDLLTEVSEGNYQLDNNVFLDYVRQLTGGTIAETLATIFRQSNDRLSYQEEKDNLLGKLRRLYAAYDTSEDYNLIRQNSLQRQIISISGGDQRNDDAVSRDFNEYMNPRINEEWNDIKNEMDIIINDISHNYNTYYNLYNSIQGRESITSATLNSIINKSINEKQEKLKEIKTNLGNFSKMTNVDLRQAYYSNENLSMYKSIYQYIIYIYYGLFLIYLIFGDFIKNKRYLNKIFYLIAIVYLIAPYIIKYIMRFAIYIYKYVLEKYNLKKPIYSYTDLLQAANIDKIYTAPLNRVKSMNDNNIDYFNEHFNINYSTLI